MLNDKGNYIMYELRDENIVWDVLSSQNVIIADLEQGYYTTLTGEGSEVLWTCLTQSISKENLTKVLEKIFLTLPDDIENSVNTIIANLTEVGILIPALCENTNIDQLIGSFSTIKQFDVNVVCYDDMQKLLQLDPIDNAIEA